MADLELTWNGIQVALLHECVAWFIGSYFDPLLRVLRSKVDAAGISKSLLDLQGDIQVLIGATSTGTRGPLDAPGGSIHTIPTRLLPLAKRVILMYRRHRVAQIEAQIEKVTDLELRANLEKIIEGTEVYNEERWFVETEPIKTPRLTDYLTLQTAEEILASETELGALAGSRLTEKQYDNKFGVLSAPSSLAPELSYWRQQCELRNVSYDRKLWMKV
jgi:hypothetical protein